MTTRHLLRLEAIVVLLLLGAPGAGRAQENRFNVTALRTERIDLYDCGADKKKTGQELTKVGFPGSLPATTESSSPLYLRVHVNGQPYCVKAFAVQTDKTIAVPETKCTQVAGKQPGSGATRGIGNRCEP
jgi:hypothetical protein